MTQLRLDADVSLIAVNDFFDQRKPGAVPFAFGGSAAGISGLASGTAERTRRLGSTAADSLQKGG